MYSDDVHICSQSVWPGLQALSTVVYGQMMAYSGIIYWERLGKQASDYNTND